MTKRKSAHLFCFFLVTGTKLRRAENLEMWHAFIWILLNFSGVLFLIRSNKITAFSSLLFCVQMTLCLEAKTKNFFSLFPWASPPKRQSVSQQNQTSIFRLSVLLLLPQQQNSALKWHSRIWQCHVKTPKVSLLSYLLKKNGEIYRVVKRLGWADFIRFSSRLDIGHWSIFTNWIKNSSILVSILPKITPWKSGLGKSKNSIKDSK